jgi:hypothetical protein
LPNNESPLLFEAVRHPPQHLCASFLKQGIALEVVKFAAWFGQWWWVAKRKDQHGTAPLELATKYRAPATVLSARSIADGTRRTTTTLAGDTLHLRGWEDAWASPGANLADALVAENRDS